MEVRTELTNNIKQAKKQPEVIYSPLSSESELAQANSNSQSIEDYIFSSQTALSRAIEISKENTVLLIPEINDYDDAHNFIKSCYEEIFEWELFGWVTAEELWPKNRSWKMFNEWFNIEINSEVFDLVDGEIEKEEL